MSGFEAEMREVAARLDVSEPGRSRLLLELRSDLEGLRKEFRARGVPEEEARRRAVGALIPSAGVAWELGEVHRPFFRRLLERWSHPGRRRAEWGLLAGLGAAAAGGGVLTLARFDLLSDASPFLWPTLVLAAAAVVLGSGRLFRLYLMGARAGDSGRGLAWLPAVALLALMTSFGGAVIDLALAAARIQREASFQAPELVAWLRRDSALLALGLLAATAAGLFWLAVAARVASLEHAEAEALGAHTL